MRVTVFLVCGDTVKRYRICLWLLSFRNLVVLQ